MEPATMQLGLLMEAAQTHQKLAEASLRKLRSQCQDLVGMVRDELRHTLAHSLQSLADENLRAAQALRAVQRVANLRVAVWSVLLTLLCSLIPFALAYWIIPSPAQIRELNATHAELERQIKLLQTEGARIDLRRCGSGSRLCVRIDRLAPAYGEKSDYLVVKGY